MDSLFSEMTLLGFIGLLFFILTTTSVLANVSEKIFHNDEIISHMFHSVHMVLFLVMILFLIKTVVLLYAGKKQQAFWRKLENNAIRNEENLEALTPTELQYYLMRQQFIKPTDVLPDITAKIQLAPEFDFASYLSQRLGTMLAELVEVPALTWAYLWVVFLGVFVLIIIFDEDAAQTGIFLGFGFAQFIICVIILRHTRSIVAKLVPQLKVNKLKGAATDIEQEMMSPAADEVHEADAVEVPLYQYHPTKEHKFCCSKKKSLPNGHQQLFWFGHYSDRSGPDFLLFLLRSLLLSSAVYLGSSLVMLTTLDAHGIYFVLILIVAFSPVVLLMWILPVCMAELCVVNSIERMKDQSTIDHVVRATNAKKSMKILEVIIQLQSAMNDIDVNVKSIDAKDVYTDPAEYKKKVSICRHTFNTLDSDGSGNIAVEEVGDLMHALGTTLEPERLANVIKSLDADGSGEISFDEFFNWTAAQEQANKSTPDLTELVNQVFDKIDVDGDDAVTIEEFQSCLKKLNQEMSIADLQFLFREVSHGGGGDTISRAQLLKLFTKYRE